MKRILVIEDDKDIVELVRYNLEKDGYQVTSSGDGSTGLAQIRKAAPDLLVLDLMLPKLSGLEICKEVRKDVTLNRIPILILTAKGEEADRVVGLELGADDYVTKPFSPRELVARVKALLRRAEPGTPSEKPVEIGALRIDPAAYRVTRTGKPVPMSTLEFRLLYFLAARPNRVFTRDQLLDAVWGTERFVTPRSVDVYVRRLREKIETDPQHPVVHENDPWRWIPLRNPCELDFSGSSALPMPPCFSSVLLAVQLYSARVIRSQAIRSANDQLASLLGLTFANPPQLRPTPQNFATGLAGSLATARA